MMFEYAPKTGIYHKTLELHAEDMVDIFEDMVETQFNS